MTVCSLCNRSFRTNTALLQHINNSQNHRPCAECDFVGATCEDLVQHYRDEGCMIVCEGCLDASGQGVVWHSKDAQYWQHVRDHNVCDVCERHFSTEDNLRNHKLTHRSADYECLACYRKFKTYGGMIIHLESGACTSGINIFDLNNTAARCFQWSQYIDEDYRQDLLDCLELATHYTETVYPYKCPECDTNFTKLSALFQHVESNSCDQTLDDYPIGKLKRFLYVVHGTD